MLHLLAWRGSPPKTAVVGGKGSLVLGAWWGLSLMPSEGAPMGKEGHAGASGWSLWGRRVDARAQLTTSRPQAKSSSLSVFVNKVYSNTTTPIS